MQRVLSPMGKVMGACDVWEVSALAIYPSLRPLSSFGEGNGWRSWFQRVILQTMMNYTHMTLRIRKSPTNYYISIFYVLIFSLFSLLFFLLYYFHCPVSLPSFLSFFITSPSFSSASFLLFCFVLSTHSLSLYSKPIKRDTRRHAHPPNSWSCKQTPADCVNSNQVIV